MKLSELKKTEIERKTNVDDDIRTPGKDEVADYIEEEVIEAGRWPMDIIEIADEVGYSRQHTTNVIREYYAPVNAEPEDTDESTEEASDEGITISVPDGMDPEEERAFLMGVAEGRRV